MRLADDETGVQLGPVDIKLLPGPGLSRDMLFIGVQDGDRLHSMCYDINGSTYDNIKRAIEAIYETFKETEEAPQVAE